MPIQSFSIRNIKAIRYAACESVPKLMIISGPNGIGKSTLLHALKQRYPTVTGSGRILYMGPHRAWRRQQIHAMYLHNRTFDFREFLTQDNLGQFDGMPFSNQSRTPDSLDEAQSLIKSSLAQIEVRRQAAVTTLYDLGGMNGRRVDVYAPLRTLVNVLLPHLQFERVSLEDKANVQCLFSRNDSPEPSVIDIDDLSSGEKALISLLLPFMEEEINALIQSLSNGAVNSDNDIVCIIDEPEVHLHPTLQQKLLDYFRHVAARGQVQFIISTHSPVIINAAEVNELFLMRPPQGADVNQILPAMSEVSRIEAIRSLTGEAFSLTSGRPLVLVEGANPYDTKDEPSDLRLIELLAPSYMRYALLSLGDKERIRQLAGALDVVLQPGNGHLAFAVTDMDQLPPTSAARDKVFTWPVAMIENFLLDPVTIYACLEPYREQTGLYSAEQIQAELEKLAMTLQAEELRLRVAARLHPFRWHFQGSTVEELLNNCDLAKQKLDAVVADRQSLERFLEETRQSLQGIIANGEVLRRFHGKNILKSFFHKYGQRTGLRYKAFCIELARTTGRIGEPEGMRTIRYQIESYIPTKLRNLLTQLVGSSASVPVLSSLTSILPALDAALDARTRGGDFDRKQLKAQLLQALHTVSVSLGQDIRDRALVDCVQESYYLSMSIQTGRP